MAMAGRDAPAAKAMMPRPPGLAAVAPVVLGDLTLSDAYLRATPPKAPVGGGFLTIANAGGDDRLVGVSAEAISPGARS